MGCYTHFLNTIPHLVSAVKIQALEVVQRESCYLSMPKENLLVDQLYIALHTFPLHAFRYTMKWMGLCAQM